MAGVGITSIRDSRDARLQLRATFLLGCVSLALDGLLDSRRIGTGMKMASSPWNWSSPTVRVFGEIIEHRLNCEVCRDEDIGRNVLFPPETPPRNEFRNPLAKHPSREKE
jgi:hypothetical protein